MKKCTKLSLLLIILSAVLTLPSFAESKNIQNEKPAIISAVGTSSKYVAPDTVVINFATEVTSKTVKEASDKNSKITNNIIAKLKDTYKTESPNFIKTSDFSIQPAYEYNNLLKKNELVGYTVSNQITITTKQLSQAGKIVDIATSYGANKVNNISFILQNQNPFIEKIIADATNNAKTQAKSAASALGLELVGVKTISISSGNEPVYARYKMFAAADNLVGASEATPIEAGQLKLQSTVNIDFLAK